MNARLVLALGVGCLLCGCKKMPADSYPPPVLPAHLPGKLAPPPGQPGGPPLPADMSVPPLPRDFKLPPPPDPSSLPPLPRDFKHPPPPPIPPPPGGLPPADGLPMP